MTKTLPNVPVISAEKSNNLSGKKSIYFWNFDKFEVTRKKKQDNIGVRIFLIWMIIFCWLGSVLGRFYSEFIKIYISQKKFVIDF